MHLHRHVIVALVLALALATTAAAEPGKADPKGKAKGHEKRATAASPPDPAPADAPVPVAPAPTAPTPTPTPHADAPAPSQPPSQADARAPTPIPDHRIDGLDEGVQTQSRAAAPRAAPLVRDASAPEDEGFPWTWALPVLGLVGLGAALATTRRGVVEPAMARRRASYITATPTLEGILAAGKTAVQAGRFEEAVAWFTQALKLDPRLAVAHFCRGVCLAAMGDVEEAYASFRRAHRIDPAEGAYRLELARAAARTGRAKEAMDALAPVLQALPELAKDAAEDEAFASLRDHPRWLAMLGRL